MLIALILILIFLPVEELHGTIGVSAGLVIGYGPFLVGADNADLFAADSAAALV